MTNSTNRGTGWDIAGKRVVITGATSGIGHAGALEIARRGADLAVVGRNPSKLAALVDELAGVAPQCEVTTFVADLADLDAVRAAGAEILDRHDRIDVLVNNAGVAAMSSQVGPSGHDEMLAANYLGPFLLTHLLLDRIVASAPSRIVFTGSEAHRMTGPFDPETFETMGGYRAGLAGQRAYGTTKLLDILVADELARRLADTDTTVTSFCPGAVSTGLVRDVPRGEQISGLLSKTPLLRTPEQGARKLVHLVCSDRIGAGDNGFHTSTPLMHRLPRHPMRRDPKVAATVVDRTAGILGVEPIG